MIVKPTVNELLEHAENRFALVIATSRRARQISREESGLGYTDDASAVTMAANEINEGKVTIDGYDNEEPENQEENEYAEKIEE